MAAFAQFGSDLDPATQKMLARGVRLVEVLKQGQYEPLPVERQVVIIYAATHGFVDHLPVEAIRRYEVELNRFLDNRHPDIFEDLRTKREIDAPLREKLDRVLEEFKKEFTA